jgi:YD repeat-containing protein
VHTSDIDPLGRLYTEVTASNETITNTYSENDLLSALTPAPSGENPKQVQTETDGLGRISKVCAIGNGSSTGCSQNTGTANGVTDSYAYTSGAGWTQAAITRGSQVRSTTFDALGRVIRRTTPEGGTWTYLYDVQSGCPSSVAGHLTVVLDPNGNGICFYYDALGRNVAQSANTANCRFFYYDNSTGFTGTRPTGISPTYSLGRIVSAATSESAGCNTLTTDEWFSYDKDGRVTDTWQSTPHSSQYYHSVATFFENGKVKTLQLASPSLYTMSYTLDGEGRWNTLTDNTSSTNVVTDATFFPAANPAVVKFQGTTPDNDAYTFDSNTGRMTQYAFSVGNTPVIMTGGLNWNPNGTLKQLTITDGFNSGGTQTCTFNPTLASGTGYDDLGRIVGVDCGSGGWGQTFSYDMYDNLSKTVMSGRTGTNWNPTYSATTNRYNCGVACTYDANGNVTGDSNNVFGWNEYSKMKWTASSGTPTCGASGMCITYDAFGRIVETSNNLAWRTRWITQLGETANMTGTTINFAYWPEPQGGTTVITGSSGAFYHLHKDWLGNARIASTITGHAVAADQAYSPYGEVYASFGATNSYFDLFAGTTSNFSNGVVWDTPNRELSVVGRWLSPDPAHMGWNQYAYEANPNGSIDPLGLGGCPAGQASCGGSHGPPGVGCTDRANTNPDCIKDIPTDPINGWDVFSLMQIPLVTWGCFGDCGYYPIGSGLDVFGSSTNTNDVNKTWTKTVACKKSATQVMSAVQHDMGQFADNFGFFTANFPDQPITMGGQYSIQPGAWIPTANLYGLPAVPLTISGKTLAVTVTSESTTGWTFTTDPSHHYFDGTVSFSSTDAGNGNVTFSITADANWVNSITQFTVGPLIMAGENSTWNNMLNNVQDYCSSPNGN